MPLDSGPSPFQLIFLSWCFLLNSFMSAIPCMQILLLKHLILLLVCMCHVESNLSLFLFLSRRKCIILQWPYKITKNKCTRTSRHLSQCHSSAILCWYEWLKMTFVKHKGHVYNKENFELKCIHRTASSSRKWWMIKKTRVFLSWSLCFLFPLPFSFSYRVNSMDLVCQPRTWQRKD